MQILSAFSKVGLSTDAIKTVYAYSVEGFSAKLNESQLAQLSNDPRVKTIEQDYLIILAPPPGKGPGGGGGGSPAQSIPYGISRVGAGQTYTGNGVAYVLDSGIDLDHEDLNVDTANSVNFVSRGKDNGGDDRRNS